MVRLGANMQRYMIGTVGGFVIGLLFLHPLSMIFQGAIHPALSLDYWRILNAFKPHHIPMAFFFGILGVAAGALITRLQQSLIQEKQRVKVLESILPVCSYCKKVRDDSGKVRGTGEWLPFEEYLVRKTGTDLSHGICGECYPRVLAEIDEVVPSEIPHDLEPAGPYPHPTRT